MRWIEASHKYILLKEASRKIAHDLGGCAYFVGSALTSETRPRDTDVRIVLSDETFEQRYQISIWDWQWEARLCEWSEARWGWYREEERCGIMIACACGERTIDCGILPETIWQAIPVIRGLSNLAQRCLRKRLFCPGFLDLALRLLGFLAPQVAFKKYAALCF